MTLEVPCLGTICAALALHACHHMTHINTVHAGMHIFTVHLQKSTDALIQTTFQSDLTPNELSKDTRSTLLVLTGYVRTHEGLTRSPVECTSVLPYIMESFLILPVGQFEQ